MKNNKIRNYGITIGSFKTGKNNSITDVKGVKVGHKTIDNGKIKTGVTANYLWGKHPDKLVCLPWINGFGKSTDLFRLRN